MSTSSASTCGPYPSSSSGNINSAGLPVAITTLTCPTASTSCSATIGISASTNINPGAIASASTSGSLYNDQPMHSSLKRGREPESIHTGAWSWASDHLQVVMSDPSASASGCASSSVSSDSPMTKSRPATACTTAGSGACAAASAPPRTCATSLEVCAGNVPNIMQSIAQAQTACTSSGSGSGPVPPSINGSAYPRVSMPICMPPPNAIDESAYPYTNASPWPFSFATAAVNPWVGARTRGPAAQVRETANPQCLALEVVDKDVIHGVMWRKVRGSNGTCRWMNEEEYDAHPSSNSNPSPSSFSSRFLQL